MTNTSEHHRPPGADVGRLLDRHLGRRLARRRRELHCSPAELDAAIGTPAGSVQRFESGVKSMDSARLMLLALALGVPVSYFFEDLPDLPFSGVRDLPDGERVEETARFIDAYYRIADARVRRDILDLLKAAAAQ